MGIDLIVERDGQLVRHKNNASTYGIPIGDPEPIEIFQDHEGQIHSNLGTFKVFDRVMEEAAKNFEEKTGYMPRLFKQIGGVSETFSRS